MPILNIDGYPIYIRWYENILPFIDRCWPRMTPRNIYCGRCFLKSILWCLLLFPLFWGLSQIPFIRFDFLVPFPIIISTIMGMRPYKDYFRAILLLTASVLLFYYKVTFHLEIYGIHLEPYFYGITAASAIWHLWRRFFNWLCWLQIDHMCDKYKIPRYDQKALMDRFEGYDTRYGSKKDGFKDLEEAQYALQNWQTKAN